MRNLQSVYPTKIETLTTLYELLKERESHQMIRHTHLPSFSAHCDFVKSNPYEHWFIIQVHNVAVGTINLSKNRQVGVFVFKRHMAIGYGSWALHELHRISPGPMYAEINPQNLASIHFFSQFDAVHVQNTYKICL